MSQVTKIESSRKIPLVNKTGKEKYTGFNKTIKKIQRNRNQLKDIELLEKDAIVGAKIREIIYSKELKALGPFYGLGENISPARTLLRILVSGHNTPEFLLERHEKNEDGAPGVDLSHSSSIDEEDDCFACGSPMYHFFNDEDYRCPTSPYYTTEHKEEEEEEEGEISQNSPQPGSLSPCY